MTRRACASAVLLGSLLASACGAPAAHGPREALARYLSRLASGNVAGVCRTLTPRAVAELARDFGGSSCSQTVTTAARYVGRRPGERAAVRGAVILPTVDIPLSPAPYRDGAVSTKLRVAFDDPVLHRRQAFDVALDATDGTWRVDSGVNGLFTLLTARQTPARVPSR